jgi:uncharacterized membrane-anchored protein YitT (DUF2179 family)
MKIIFSHIKQFFSQIEFTKRALWDYVLILLGAFIQAMALRLFLVPSDLVSGGISGLAQLINHYSSFPIVL